jgi:hypothetical protein
MLQDISLLCEFAAQLLNLFLLFGEQGFQLGEFTAGWRRRRLGNGKR